MQELTEWCGLVAVAFNSIYINRSKDSSDDIRLLCVENLEQFIRLDSSKAIKTEYLKYLGWSCYDYSHAVRFEAVRSLNSLVQVILLLVITFWNKAMFLIVFGDRMTASSNN